MTQSTNAAALERAFRSAIRKNWERKRSSTNAAVTVTILKIAIGQPHTYRPTLDPGGAVDADAMFTVTDSVRTLHYRIPLQPRPETGPATPTPEGITGAIGGTTRKLSLVDDETIEREITVARPAASVARVTSTSAGRDSGTTTKPWFCEVISTLPVARSLTG